MFHTFAKINKLRKTTLIQSQRVYTNFDLKGNRLSAKFIQNFFHCKKMANKLKSLLTMSFPKSTVLLKKCILYMFY